MAENKMTLDEAIKLANEGDYSKLDNVQLSQMNRVLNEAASKEGADQDLKDTAEAMVLETENRLTELNGKTDFAMGDLDSIIDLASSISGFSKNADLARAVLEKATNQKENPTSKQMNEAALDDILASDQYTDEEKDLALDAAIEYNNEIDAKAAASEFEVGEADTGDTETNEEQVEDVSVNEGAEAPTPENQHDTAEPETSVGAEEVENDGEELTFPEGKPSENMSDKEFDEMLDPLAGNIPEMTKEEKKRQAERLEAVMALNESNPYQHQPEESIDKTLDFTVEQTAIRRLTISNDEITKENLETAREAENERISIEYYNAVFGACKTSEELDKETPAQHVERLGKVADLVSKKRPKEEIYAAMGINPTKEQETIAANAVYRMNAEPAMSWAKKLGKTGLKFMDKYREFEKNNPTLSLGLGLAMSGNPFYMGARMALSARGLYKDYEAYKAKHPNEKFSFIGMLKDKETRKSLAANAGIFIRSVPVVGQAYGMYGMAKQLQKTCKKGFWKDLGSKFKEAGLAIKEVAKNPKDKSKWKDMAHKVQTPLAITAGVALAAYGAYKGVEHFTSDRDGDGIPDYKDADHGEGWATANEQQLDGLMNDAESVNAILGEGHNHTPEELREMLSKGEFTDEQLKDIHELATKGFDEKGVAIDKDKDGVADYKDADHGAGWATANDKQLDGLMNDAESVNAILGEGHNHTPDELRAMLAKGENEGGGFTTEQLKEIHKLASKAFDENGTAVDKDGDGIADYKDVDHGEGWATANETQLDRLMDADARGVNAILNDGKWHSSAELKDMMAKGENVEGGFTTEQLKAIHELATKEFDENGHIIDKDLNKLYEDLARQAAAKDAPQETPEENKGAEQTEPTEVEKTPAEKQMYEAILATISKGEDMNNPEVKASVEALAQQHFNDVKGALAAGNEQAAVDLLHNLHKQGEAVEVQEATQREDDDSRGVRHAKEDLAKVSSRLDEAKAALAADPNNEQLQREVENLEKEFDKKSLNLDNKEIKQERSELKEQINRDNRSADNLDWTREQLEKNLGISQEAADKQLAAAGFDLNNLPKDTENLPEDVQKLINAHNQYAQVDQTEAALRGRVAENEQAREDLKAQEKENKEAMKDVKKGRGFSTDDEKRASIEDRLPGQSDFRDSELASSLVNMARGGNEAATATQEPEKAESNEENVDRFLRDQVAKGNMTEAEAQEQREALIAKANAQKANEEYAQHMANPENWQEYQAQIDPSPLQGKPETAPVYQPENEGATSDKEPEKEGATSNKEQEEKQETSEVVVEPLVAESKAGNITYSMDDNGQYRTGGTISVIKDYEKYNEIKREISDAMGNTPGKSTFAGCRAQVAYMADAINKDIEARLARGEDVPHAKEMMEMNNKQLKAMGLEYDKDGHLHSSNSNSGKVQTRGRDRD